MASNRDRGGSQRSHFIFIALFTGVFATDGLPITGIFFRSIVGLVEELNFAQSIFRVGAHMKWIVAVLCFASLPHTLAKKEVGRGVFVSAQELAVSCQAMKDALGEDYVVGPRQGGTSFARPAGSDIDMAPVGRCMGYIEGVADEFREADSHYRPFPAGRGELPALIETFLKRVAEHPEEADFSASTVLHEADKDLLSSCGDCNFGVIVRPGGRK